MKYLLLLLCLVACSPTSRYTVKSDNDLYGGKKTDQDYSAGQQFGAEMPDATGSHEVYGRQLIYTPVHKQIEDPIPTERPYSGYLGGGYRANYVNDNRQDTFGIEGGIVGPSSLAEQTQATIHRIVGDKLPKGWGHQLHDEPVLLLTAERKCLYDLSKNISVLPLVGVQAGNMFDQAYAGATLRYGMNVPNDFYSGDPIFPRAPHQLDAAGKPISVWVFGTGLERAVARNIFLDGNTFRDSRSVDSEPFVAEGRLGIAGQWNGYRIALTEIMQSKEYSTQERGPVYGEVTFGWGW